MLGYIPWFNRFNCRRRDQPSATHTFLQVVQGLCVDAPVVQRATTKHLWTSIVWHEFCWHQKFQNTWWMSKTFFLNTLSSFAESAKKSPHPAKHRAQNVHQDSIGEILMIGPWKIQDSVSKIDRKSKLPSLQDRPLEPQLKQSFRW